MLEYRICRLECSCGTVLYELLQLDPSDSNPTTQETFTPDFGGEESEQAVIDELKKAATALDRPVVTVRTDRCRHT